MAFLKGVQELERGVFVALLACLLGQVEPVPSLWRLSRGWTEGLAGGFVLGLDPTGARQGQRQHEPGKRARPCAALQGLAHCAAPLTLVPPPKGLSNR